jgi:hypothetical protein
LERYFTVTDSKFGILTNGVEYWFYSDLERPNVMDKNPFLIVNVLELKNRDVKELSKFQNESFDVDNILSMAGARKYVSIIKDIFKEEVREPSDDLVRFFASRITNKPLRQNIIEEFRIYTKRALSEIVNDMVSEKINNLSKKLSEDATSTDEDEPIDNKKDKGIVTTDEELEGFFIVKSILAEKIELNRIYPRDTKSYFGILLDDNNRKWIARLHFNYSNKYLEVRVDDKDGEKYQLDKLEDIYKYKEQLIKAIEIVD